MKNPTPKAHRRSFSLDQAAYIRQMIDDGERLVCPECTLQLYVLVGSMGTHEVMLLRCDTCNHVVTMERKNHTDISRTGHRGEQDGQTCQASRESETVSHQSPC